MERILERNETKEYETPRDERAAAAAVARDERRKSRRGRGQGCKS